MRPCSAQVNNPCGVVASIYPAAQDSVVPPNTIINFTSTSTNATSVQWLYDGFPWVTGNSINISIPPGMIRLSLVAYKDNCTDTTTVVYFSPGTYHNTDTFLLAHYGTSRYNEEATCIDKTLDSGFIAAGVQYPWDLCGEIGVLVKVKDQGCIEWSKKLLSPYFCHNSGINAIHAGADSNYFIVTATKSELVKLDKAGNFLWSKRFLIDGIVAVFSHITGDQQGNAYIAMINPYFTGWHLLKIDGNGNVVWNKYFSTTPWPPSFSSPEFMRPTDITWKNGKLYVSGNIHNSQNGSSFTSLTKIDAVSGIREWQYRYEDADLPGILGFEHLSWYDTLLMTSHAAQGHVVTLIDQQGNVKKSIKAKYLPDYGPHVTKAVAGTNGRIFMMQWMEQGLPLQPGYQYYSNVAEIDTSMNKYGVATFDEYSRPWFTDIAMGLKNKAGVIGTHFGYVNDTWGSRDMRLLRVDSLIASDSYCYGYDNSYPVSLKTIHRYGLNYVVDSSLTVVTQPGTPHIVVDAYLASRYNCPDYIDSCSFLKLTGPLKLCSFENSYTYRIHRNRACVITPQFQLPAGVIITGQTDSTISLKFPGFGSYPIAAKLNSCIPVKDSLIVTIASKSYPLDLGNDTTICSGTSIKLRAAKNFFSYLWNDGSTDSTLTITQPGLYWVETIDSCNNLLRDSVTVTSFYLPINIGPDRVKCNNDTLHLNGPPGFISYTWFNNYNISSTNTQNTIVNPLVDTIYYLKAEKLPGCFSYDTIGVTVHHSPPIYLGTDVPICRGDSLQLDAGNGFTQYLWSNGMNSQQVFINTAGPHSVIGITAQGCKSADTLLITQLLPLPVITLNQDPKLCIGDSRILDAGPGYAIYSWNTGSNSQTITVSNTGQYSVLVSDNNGCKGGDTTVISQLLAIPSKFLGPDTAICSYGDLQLKTTTSFSQYTWSTGSPSSSIIIKQPGVYWLQVKDGNGCIGKDSILVNPKDCLKGFFMPTGFTPNNDGKNDLLKPILLGDVVQYRLWIYNRWGELIFETADLTKGWNGVYKGVPQDGNVFVWMCKYQFEGEALKVEKGTAVLIR